MLPKCCSKSCSSSTQHPNSNHWVRIGFYYRKSDSQYIKRWRCSFCGKTISQATTSPCFKQHKRRLNDPIYRLLSSSVSQRRTALLLRTNLKTVARKLRFLAEQKKIAHQKLLESQLLKPNIEVQFDEMETHEHSKWKPLSICLFVNQDRKILGFRVSSMSARGRDAAQARKKYGSRPDHRKKSLISLVKELAPVIAPDADIVSDEKAMYPCVISKVLPRANHKRYRGRRGCIVGQGELKKIGLDPLFKLNHTAAMLRANVNRLVRRTWCTTKKTECLVDHLWLYLSFHNEVLTATEKSAA